MSKSNYGEKRKREIEEPFAAKRSRFAEEVAEDAQRNGSSLRPIGTRFCSFYDNDAGNYATVGNPASARSPRPSSRYVVANQREQRSQRAKSQRSRLDEQRLSTVLREEPVDIDGMKRTHREVLNTSAPVEIKDSFENTSGYVSEGSNEEPVGAAQRYAAAPRYADDTLSFHGSDTFVNTDSSSESDARPMLSNRRLKKLKKVKSAKDHHRIRATSPPGYRRAVCADLIEKVRKGRHERDATARKPKTEDRIKDEMNTDDSVSSDEELDLMRTALYPNESNSKEETARIALDPLKNWDRCPNAHDVYFEDSEPEHWEDEDDEEAVEAFIQDPSTGKSKAARDNEERSFPRSEGTRASSSSIEQAMHDFLNSVRFSARRSVPIPRGTWPKKAQEKLYEEFESAARSLYISYITSKTIKEVVSENDENYAFRLADEEQEEDDLSLIGITDDECNTLQRHTHSTSRAGSDSLSSCDSDKENEHPEIHKAVGGDSINTNGLDAAESKEESTTIVGDSPTQSEVDDPKLNNSVAVDQELLEALDTQSTQDLKELLMAHLEYETAHGPHGILAQQFTALTETLARRLYEDTPTAL